MSGISDTTGSASTAVRGLTDAMETFSTAGFKTSTVLKDMVSAFDKGTLSAEKFVDTISTGLGNSESIKVITDSLKGVLRVMGDVTEIAYESVKAYDAMDSGLRTFAKDQFQLAAGIGATFEESEKFAKSYRKIIDSNSELSRAGLYIGSQDVKNTIGVLQKAGITIDELGEKSSVGIRNNKEYAISNAQTMAAQAEAMGMTVETYSGKMATMVRKSGLSMQDSMKLMAASQDIARNTGLTVDEVTASLEGATSSFQRMGTTIDFGRPILKGFADSLKEVGLGVAQAGDLTSAFSQSLLKIVDSPALAYMTSLKGGFGAAAGGGAGGILAPSIQMQAQMMDQTPGSQAELARNLSEGMRETLKSFTGGDIITVKEAAASPELSTQFYTQQKMLGSTYGISDSGTQNRVLEYLSQLEDATYAGDQDTVDMLSKQIEEATKSNDKTMSLQEKMSQDIERSKMLIDEQVQLMKIDIGETFKQANYGSEWKEMYSTLDRIGGKGQGEKTQTELMAELKKFTENAMTRHSAPLGSVGAAEATQLKVAEPGGGTVSSAKAPQVNEWRIVIVDQTKSGIGLKGGATGAEIPGTVPRGG